MSVVPIVAKPTTMTMLMISMRFQLRNNALRSMAKWRSQAISCCEAEEEPFSKACKHYLRLQTWGAVSGPLAELRACGIPWNTETPSSVVVTTSAMIEMTGYLMDEGCTGYGLGVRY